MQKGLSPLPLTLWPGQCLFSHCFTREVLKYPCVWFACRYSRHLVLNTAQLRWLVKDTVLVCQKGTWPWQGRVLLPRRLQSSCVQKKLLYTCAETSAKERKFKTGPNKLKVERKMNRTASGPASFQADDFKSFLLCWQLSSSPLHSLSISPKKYISALALFSLLSS